MKITQLALSVLLSMALSASLASLAKTSHNTSESSGDKTTAQAESADTGKAAVGGEHKKKRHEKKQTEASAQEQNKTATTTESKKSNPLFRLFAPQATKKEEATSTEPKKEAKSRETTLKVSGSHEGEVFVHGYTTKTGKKVEGYWRRKPHAS